MCVAWPMTRQEHLQNYFVTWFNRVWWHDYNVPVLWFYGHSAVGFRMYRVCAGGMVVDMCLRVRV